ncbi:MAG TPA: hypothetical protein ENH28_05440 [Euryarchaeota archaeon]|nr:hypothetical protein [Euryarchaeota archaeon]
MISGLCHICGKPAKFTCALCGKPVCEKHLSPGGICMTCFQGKKI